MRASTTPVLPLTDNRLSSSLLSDRLNAACLLHSPVSSPPPPPCVFAISHSSLPISCSSFKQSPPALFRRVSMLGVPTHLSPCGSHLGKALQEYRGVGFVCQRSLLVAFYALNAEGDHRPHLYPEDRSVRRLCLRGNNFSKRWPTAPICLRGRTPHSQPCMPRASHLDHRHLMWRQSYPETEKTGLKTTC